MVVISGIDLGGHDFFLSDALQKFASDVIERSSFESSFFYHGLVHIFSFLDGEERHSGCRLDIFITSNVCCVCLDDIHCILYLRIA